MPKHKIPEWTERAAREVGFEMKDDGSGVISPPRGPHGHYLPGVNYQKLFKGSIENLGKRFRRQTREMLAVDEEIRALIRARVVAELRGDLGKDGKPVDMRLTPVLCKIAGGQYYMKREDGPQFSGPAIHVHLAKLSDEELTDFVQKGIRPASLRAIEAAPQQEPQEPESEGDNG